jgi:tetratricopeptide (TPR) repeat protein
MSRRYIYLSAIMLLVTLPGIAQQLFTMSNKCLEQTNRASVMNDEKKYDSALALYNSITKSCNSKDGKEIIFNGKARSYNGQKKYDDAIAMANNSLKLTKNTSINAYFERAMAFSGKKDIEASRADFTRIIELTEKNQNVKEKAAIYAMIGDQYYKSGMKDSANANLNKAIELDPGNANFYIQKGDMAARENNYDEAFVNYDKAVAMGRTDVSMYKIRAGARVGMVQKKYHTENAQELRSKMTPKEKEQVCTELKKAIELGYKDMKADMFSALVCQ